MRNAIFFAFWLGFHVLFWKQGFGLNALIFGLALQLYAKYDSGFKVDLKREWVYLFSFLASAYGLMVYHCVIGQVSFVLVNLVYLSYHYRKDLSPFEHGVNSVIRPFQLRQPLFADRLLDSATSRKKVLSYLSLSFIPIVLVIIFTALFRAGNPVFKQWSQSFIDLIINYLPDYEIAWIFFMILGLMILRIAFLKKKEFYWLLQPGDFVLRKIRKGKRFFKPLALKNEYRLALMVFASLNVLILIVNIIDFQSFWFGFNMPQGFSLKEFLHEGVWALFMSIILATALSFYFFRGNLNYFPKNRNLVVLAQVWVAQNIILSISVFLRSWYYIDFHGLANGRILVIATLCMVILVLALLFIKIRTSRNAAFTVRHSSFYLGLLLAFCSLVNWDAFILKFNLSHGRINEIDVDNYLYLNPRVYPYLLSQLDRVEEQIEAHQENSTIWISVESRQDFENRLYSKIDRFIRTEELEGWQSWNYADARAYEFLKGADAE